MSLSPKSKINHAIYFVTLVAGIFSVYFYMNYSLSLFVTIGLLVLTFSGWIHFLRLAVTNKKMSFDKKLVWFIALFSFYFLTAPLFLLLVVNKNQEK